MKLFVKIAALILSSVAAVPAFSQTWPTKPVKIVVNFPPGGAADQLARLIAQPLQQTLGQPVIVENKGGAGGNIGADTVAKATADGYTLLMSSGGVFSINPHIYPKMPFDPAKDFVSVAAVARVPFYLVVRADSPMKDFKGFLADIKANPGKRTYGSPGSGSSPHLAAEMLKSRTNIETMHVPYRGAAPALNDLLGGQIDFMFDPGIAIPHVKAGKVRMLAVGSPQRVPLFPDLPTLDELGLKGFDTDAFFGLYAPAGTPDAVVKLLNAEVNRALTKPELAKRITELGNVPAPMTQAQFKARSTADFERFGVIIRERGIKAE